MISTATEARAVQLSDEQYHADTTAISRGKLWTYRNSRRKFEGEHVTFTAPPAEPKDYYDIGTLTHTGCLEPHKLGDKFIAWPDGLLSADGGIRTAAAKQWQADQRADGRIPLKDKQYQIVGACAASVLRTCGQWIEKATAIEQSIFWTDAETGILCRCKPDWQVELPHCVLAFDIKTDGESVDEHVFRGKCETNGYVLQVPHYSAGITALTGKPVHFHFVVVEKVWPFRSRVFRLDEQATANAVDMRRRLLDDLLICIESGDFSEPWEAGITELDIRRYAFE